MLTVQKGLMLFKVEDEFKKGSQDENKSSQMGKQVKPESKVVFI
jgi:hypothetical protein